MIHLRFWRDVLIATAVLGVIGIRYQIMAHPRLAKAIMDVEDVLREAGH